MRGRPPCSSPRGGRGGGSSARPGPDRFHVERAHRLWTGAPVRTRLGPPTWRAAMSEPHLRAADADRAAVATVLGEHMSAGRLTLDEYDERLSRAYAAKTYGELDQITADLPSPGLAARPAAAPAAPAPAATG